MTQDLYYYESGYFTPDTGYFVYTADAEAAVSSNFTASITANRLRATPAALTSAFTESVSIAKITQAVAALNSAFSQSATISHIEGADLYSLSSATMTIQVMRLRDNNIAVTSAYTITANAERVRYYSSAASSTATVAADNLRVRYDQAALDAAFSLATPIERIRSFVANQSSAFTQTSTEDYLRRTSAALSSTAAFYCDPERIPGGVVVSASGSWTSAFTLAGSIINIHGTDLTAFSNATVSADANRIRALTSNQSSSATVSVTALRIQSTTAAWSSNAAVSAVGVVTRKGLAALTSTATLSGVISDIRGVDMTAFTNASMTIAANRLRSTPAALSSAFSLSASAVRTRNINSNQSSAFTLSANIIKLKGTSANLLSAFSLTTTAYIANKRPRQIFAINGNPAFVPYFKYGTNSLDITDIINIDGILLNASEDYEIATNEDFVIETWVRPTYSTWPANGRLWPIVQLENTGASTSSRWGIFVTDSGYPYFTITADNTSTQLFSLAPSTVVLDRNEWNWISVSRTSGVISLKYKTANNSNIQTTSATYTSAIQLSGRSQNLRIGGTRTNNSYGYGFYGYIDELYMAKGTGVSRNYTGPVTQGKDSTTVFLFHFDGNYTDDMTWIADAQAALTSTALITATPAAGIKPALAALSSAFTQVTQARKSTEETLTAFSNASVTATPVRIKQLSAGLTSAFTQTTFALDLDLATVNLISTATLTAALTRKYAGGVGILSSNFTSSINANENPNPTPRTFRDFTFSLDFRPTSASAGARWFQSIARSNFSTATELIDADLTISSGSSYLNVNLRQLEKVSTNRYRIITRGITFSLPNSYTNSISLNTYHSFQITWPTTWASGSASSSTKPSGTSASIDGTSLFAVSDAIFYTAGDDASATNLNTYGLTASGYYVPYNGSFTQTYSAINSAISTGTTYSFVLGAIASADIPAAFTLTASGQRIKLYNAALSSTANITASGNRLRTPNPTNINSAFTEIIVAQKNVKLQSYQTTTASLSAANSRIRSSACTATAISSINVAASSVNKTFTSAASSAFTLSATIKRTRGMASAVSSAFTLTAPPYNFTKATAGLTSAFTETATALRIQKSTAALTAFATELAAVAKIGRTLVSLQSTATVSAVTRKDAVGSAALTSAVTVVARPYNFTKATATLTSAATVSTTNKRLRGLAANVTSTATLTANVTKLKAVQATLTSAFTETIVAKKNVKTSSTMLSAFTQTTVNKRNRFGQATLSSTATVSATGKRLRLATANLQSEFTEFVVGGVYVRFEVHLEAFDTVLVAGRVINIDPALQLKISAETRTITIAEETRELLIQAETRVNIIKD